MEDEAVISGWSNLRKAEKKSQNDRVVLIMFVRKCVSFYFLLGDSLRLKLTYRCGTAKQSDANHRYLLKRVAWHVRGQCVFFLTEKKSILYFFLYIYVSGNWEANDKHLDIFIIIYIYTYISTVLCLW